MEKLKYALLVFLLATGIRAQIDIRPYEQVAIDYFASDIAESYSNLEYFIFNGDIETELSVSYSFCMSLDRKDDYQLEKNTTKINPPYPKVVRKLSFIKRLFTSKKKIGHLYVFRHYPKDGNVVVVINLSTKYMDEFISILINKTSKQVIDYCKKIYYE